MIKEFRKLSLFVLALTLAGCSAGYISVDKIKTNSQTFASRFAKTPDPRALNPPEGEKLYITWVVPTEFKPHMYRMKVDIIYRNLETETLIYPLKRRAGAMVIEMLGKEFVEKKGYLSYKFEIVSVDGDVVADFTHRMWVDLILPCNPSE